MQATVHLLSRWRAPPFNAVDLEICVRRVTRHDFLDQHASRERVLVVVFLRGGADGLTLVPPIGDDAYRRARPLLAVAPAESIDLDGYFALNARMAPLMPLVESGALQIVHGAGSEDTSRSHFEAQDSLEHGGNEGAGWLARYLRARHAPASALSAVAIGATLPESLRGAPSGAVIQSLDDFSFADDEHQAIDALQKLYEMDAAPLGKAGRDTIAAVRRLREIRSRNSPPEHGAQYPQGSFGDGLRELARLIKADVGLVASTIDLDGWDTHFVQSQLIGGLMDQLAQGLAAFMTDLGTLSEIVTMVTMTEFGRRLRENSSFGTDHGAGSVMLLLNAPTLDSGVVLSQWRNLAENRLVGPGDVPVDINYRNILAPILRQHEPEIDLSSVFPGLDRWTSGPLSLLLLTARTQKQDSEAGQVSVARGQSGRYAMPIREVGGRTRFGVPAAGDVEFRS